MKTILIVVSTVAGVPGEDKSTIHHVGYNLVLIFCRIPASH